jgi:ADP-ribose pyrophosphatase YjhB (NUDIX family)
MGIDKITPGTAAVIWDTKRNSVLLHLRNDKPMWSLPGGPPDFGESFADCIIREVKEETGLDVEIVRLIGVYSEPKYWIFSYPDGNKAHAFAAAFECRVVSGELVPNMIDSLEVKWFPVDDLPNNLMPMHPKVISDCITGAVGVFF